MRKMQFFFKTKAMQHAHTKTSAVTLEHKLVISRSQKHSKHDRAGSAQGATFDAYLNRRKLFERPVPARPVKVNHIQTQTTMDAHPKLTHEHSSQMRAIRSYIRREFELKAL